MNPESVKYNVSLAIADVPADDPIEAVEAFIRATREEGRTLAYRVASNRGELFFDIRNTSEAADLVAQKDAAYGERNQLVAALSKLFPASVEQHVGEDWDDDWRNVIFIDLPTGQASWHIHDSELPLFEHLSRNQGRSWDGHTTEEKYRRLAALEVTT